MTKSVFGSFFINCDIGSEYGRTLNKDIPTYEGKEVVILQVEIYPYKDTVRMLYELIYKE